ncbi:MAG: alpha/beta hydrolase [Propionibacteriales bacterium]|nr:alpha/beta hydrolase [Propionibacteriales bacterium]
MAHVVEPWEFAARDFDCREWLEGEARALTPDTCASSDRVVTATSLRALDRSTWGPITAAYLQSFGAVRTADALAGSGLQPRIVFESPAPPRSTTLTTLAGERSRLAVESALNSPAPCEDDACVAERKQLLRRLLGGEVRGVTPDQAAMGILAAAADPRANADFFDQLWRDEEFERRSTANALRVAALGQSLRWASGKPQPALIGYLNGMCGTYSFGEFVGDSADSVHEVLASRLLDSLWASCRAWPTRAERPRTLNARSLLVINEADPIVSRRLQLEWRAVLGASLARVLTFARSGHGKAPRKVEREVRGFLAEGQ